jgi:hypothetical protein
MLDSGAIHFSDEEMAARASAAARAASEARALAGGEVIWCCAALRIVENIDYECQCDENEVYRIVNASIAEDQT